jgi:glycosyltransferase involved in cell wall biosynthesis
MKLLFMIEHLGLGGVVRQLSILADHLERRGHQTVFLALYPIDENWNAVWKGTFNVLTEKPTGILPAAVGFSKAALALRRQLKTDNIDIVYSFQGPNSNLIAWLATRGMANTQLVWGLRGAGRQMNWKRALPSRFCKWVSRSVPLMITNSEAGLTQLNLRGYRCARQLVINNGFDLDEFKPDPEARIRLRSNWNIKNEPLIGVVGRLFISKAYAIFLEAAALLRKDCNDVRFVIVGDGPEKRELKLLSKKLGLNTCVIWAGVRRDMPAVYSAMDIFCSSSLSEGFPNVIAEAMACGVPCVVTDVGDSAKIVGNEGVLVPPGNPQMLADGLRTMLFKGSHRKSFDTRGRIVKHFSLQNMIDATEKALKGIFSCASLN